MNNAAVESENNLTRSLTTEPKRLYSFASFFKNYMSVSALITAALPIPITSFQLIPSFQDQTKIYGVYTSLFCFLLLGYVFYIRHWLARRFFLNKPSTKRSFSPSLISGLPLILMLLSFGFAIYYHYELGVVIDSFERNVFNKPAPTLESGIESTFILANAEITKFPQQGMLLMLSYLGIFLFAESAFMLMAIKEYMQDLLHITEKQIIYGNYRTNKANVELIDNGPGSLE